MAYYVSAALKTLSFFTILPIATHLLSKAEVGKFFFWIAIVQLGAGITTLGFSSAVARRAYNLRTTDYIAAAGLISAIFTWAVVAMAGFAAGLVSAAVAAAWLARSASLIGEARTIARSEIRKLSASYTIYAVALPLTCLAAVTMYRPTHEALLLGFVVAEAIIAITGLSSLRFRIRRNLHMARTKFLGAVRTSALYGLPIMIAGLANMGLNSADRFIVTGFKGFEAVAEFSLMYTIAFASARFITGPANMKIFPEFVRGHKDDQVLARIRNASGLAWLASAFYCAAIAALGPWIVRLLLSPDYDLQSVDFALVSAASAMFLFFTINSSHLKLANRTAAIMLILFVALAVSVTLSVLLVPELGYRGASVSTFVTYTGLAVWAFLRLRPVLFNGAWLAGGAALIAITVVWAFAA